MTTLSTPAGRPASSSVAASASIVSGVSSAGLTTIVQPAAMAGPILRVPMASGKFHGVMNRQGPTGLLDRQQPAASGRRLHPAAVDAHGLLGEPAEELRAVGDLALRLLDGLAHLEAHQLGEVVGPLGDQLERAAQDLAALARRRRPPLLLGLGGRVERVDGVVDVAVGDSAMTEPSAGSRTEKVAPLLASRQEPPMKSRRCSGMRSSRPDMQESLSLTATSAKHPPAIRGTGNLLQRTSEGRRPRLGTDGPLADPMQRGVRISDPTPLTRPGGCRCGAACALSRPGLPVRHPLRTPRQEELPRTQDVDREVFADGRQGKRT